MSRRPGLTARQRYHTYRSYGAGRWRSLGVALERIPWVQTAAGMVWEWRLFREYGSTRRESWRLVMRR